MNPFIRKLRHGARLLPEDEAILARLAEPGRRAGRGDIVPEGTPLRSVILVMEGWVCRYRQLENGKRQITSIFLPGDLCEPFGGLPRVNDCSLAALTPVVLVRHSPLTMRDAARASPQVEEALWWDLVVSDAMQREHVISLGRRSATQRLAHFFCTVYVRLAMAGLAERGGYDLPLTQAELADLFGLSAVHVNRSIQELRSSSLLSLRGRRLTIHDLTGLRELSMFDPGFLSPDSSLLDNGLMRVR